MSSDYKWTTVWFRGRSEIFLLKTCWLVVPLSLAILLKLLWCVDSTNKYLVKYVFFLFKTSEEELGKNKSRSAYNLDILLSTLGPQFFLVSTNPILILTIVYQLFLNAIHAIQGEKWPRNCSCFLRWFSLVLGASPGLEIEIQFRADIKTWILKLELC